MLKQLVVIILFLSTCFIGTAQSKNYFEIAGETPIPVLYTKFGLGLSGKYLMGKKPGSKITLTAGVSWFKNETDHSIQSQSTTLLPVFIGYRRSINSFYIEPQIGFGAMNGHIEQNGDFYRPSVASLFWAINAGYKLRKLTGGFRFQSAQGIDSPDAGLWYNHGFHYVSFFVGFSLF